MAAQSKPGSEIGRLCCPGLAAAGRCFNQEPSHKGPTTGNCRCQTTSGPNKRHGIQRLCQGLQPLSSVNAMSRTKLHACVQVEGTTECRLGVASPAPAVVFTGGGCLHSVGWSRPVQPDPGQDGCPGPARALPLPARWHWYISVCPRQPTALAVRRPSQGQAGGNLNTCS